MLPGAPSDPDPTVWKKFIHDNDLGVSGNRVSSNREKLLCKKLSMEIDLLEFRILKEEGRLITKEQHDEYLGRLGTAIRSALLSLENIAPRLAGKSQSEMRLEIRKEIDRYILMFQKTMDQWDFMK